MGAAILKLTRVEAIRWHQQVLDLHTIMRRHAILDVFADAADRIIGVMRDEIEYLGNISDERFQEWIAPETQGADASDMAAREAMQDYKTEPQILMIDSPLTGPLLEIHAPTHGVQVQVNDKRVWVNVDGVCRMRVSGAPEIEVERNGIKLKERKA